MNRISLRYRIALVILLLEAIMVSLVLWRSHTVSYNEINSRLHEHEDIYLGVLSDLGHDALITTEYGELQHYVDRLKKIVSIESILITDHRNIIVVSSEHKLIGSLMPVLKDDKDRRWESRSIYVASGNIGNVYINFSQKPVRAAYRKSIMHGVTVAGISMIVIAIAGLMIGHVLVRRLDRLNDAAKKMIEGDLDTQSEISGSDEVAQLSNTFNIMAQTIKSSIDAIKFSEHRIAEAHELNESILNTGSVGILTYNATGQCVFANEAAAKIAGTDVEGLLSQNVHQLDSWKSSGMYETAVRALSTGIEQQTEVHVKTTFGKDVWLSLRFSSFGSNGEKHLLVFTYDITEQKQAEEALLESKKNFAAVAENANDGILIAFVSGVHCYANQRASEITGYSIDELQHMNMRQLAHPDEVEKLTDRLRRRISGEKIPSPYLTRIVSKSGVTVPIEISSAQTIWHGQLADLVLVRDITERKKTEEETRRSLKEKEVMLKEIHHRVKNNLQVIQSLLSLQANRVLNNEARYILDESKNRIRSMALIHEKLYRSSDLAYIDFKEYLQTLVSDISESYGRHDIDISVDMENIMLNVNTGVPCGLIVNELVSNCFKHAFSNGKKGLIKLGINKNSEGNNVLLVKDNGIGLPEKVDFENSESLGFVLVKGLTGQINGTLEISRGEGTTFIITFPGT